MVITVTCPSCSSSFPVDPAKIPEGGVNARCSSCAKVFRVEKPAAAEPTTPPEPESVAEGKASPEPDTSREHDPSPGPDVTPEPDAVTESDADDWVVEHDERPEIEPDPLPPVDDRLPEISSSDEPASDPFSGQVSRGNQVSEVAQAPEPEAHTLPAPTPPAPEDSDPEGPGSRFEFDDGSGDADPDTSPEAEPGAVVDETATSAGSPVKGFTFGKRDPTDKAKRLARVLVSDMIMYNAERHQSALGAGTLVGDFEEEIQKSWKEYVDQVGADMANGEGRKFWTDALNDILAKGKQVF